MKKFLSVLLTMAMVMSLFTGTVLAAPSVVPVTTTHADVNGGKPLNLGTTQLVEVVKGNASAVATSDYWAITDASGNTVYLSPSKVIPAVSAVTVTSGGVTTTTYTYTYTYDLSLVNIVIAANATQNVYNVVRSATLGGAALATKPFQVVRPMTVNGTTDNPSVKLNTNFALAGTITGGNANMRVALMDSSDVVYTLIPVMSDGTFNLTYKLTTVGTYYVAVNGTADTADKYTIYKTINFEADENLRMTITKSPVTLNQMNYVAGGNQISIDLVAKADSANLTSGSQNLVVFQIKYPNGALYEIVNPTTGTTALSDGWIVYKLTNHTLSTVGAPAAYAAGTYTISAILFSADQSAALAGKTKLSELLDAGAIAVRKAADVTFTVVGNLATLFSDVKLNGATSSYPLGNTAQDNVNIALTPPTGKTISKVVVTVTGPIVNGTKTHTETAAPTGFNVPVDLNGYGKVMVKGTVTYTDKTTEDFDAELTSRGYVTEFTPADVLGQVNAEVTLSAIVTTSSGIPVNNAVVTWEAFIPGTATPLAAFKEWDTTDKVFKSTTTATIQINGQSSIISNGTYSQLVKLVKYADVRMHVKVTTGAGSYYSYYESKVYGAEVYTVDPIANLTATKSQTFNVVMKNASGVAIQPNFVAIDDTATPGILAVNPTTFTYDGTTGKLTVKPVKTGTFTLLVGTDSGDKMAMVDVTVVAPVATVTVNGVESNKVTAGFRDKVVVTFADTAASVVDTSPTITASTLDGAIYNAATAGVAYAAGTTENTVSGIVTFYPEYSIYKATDKGSFAIEASFDGGTNFIKVATLEVVHPVLSFGDVKELEVGSVVDVNLTLTDANNKPLKGYDIKATDGAAFAGNAVVKTDDNGKAVLTVSPTAVGRLTLEVQGLKSVYDNTLAPAAAVNFSAYVNVVRDTTGPVITMDEVYPVTTLPATVTFKVTDGNMRNLQVWIGNDQAVVRRDGTVNLTVSNLKVGENTFAVTAFDEGGYSTDATLVIEYLKPATVVLTIGSTDATKDGAAMTGMDQAPTIVNGRTFLPVRFVFVNLLGGTIEWDATTQTITSVVKGNTIKMVVGSKTAFVNGNAVALLEAPYIEAATGRTLVPMREIMEAIGISLTWNATTQTVSIVIPQ